ncbi:hypothetical protein DM02DRAFT_34127 [Periconia macrospinosa]|uniref:Uncharacterized protein n=1 Tax=Periconia macrospinosa TaxID=97972 RepID=A0A2V1E6F8_9PLEO|nr:hypothetical protein DM02DRAFT_34127 [Periconia macrospinosa]
MPKGSSVSFGNLRPTSSPQCVFSAEHMNMYVTWLQQTCKLNVDATSAPFPNAREFNAFIRAQGPRYPQARAHCQHVRHPNDRFSKEYCPVCLFHIHINYIKFIDVAWDRKGGPYRKADADEEYAQIGRARHFARMELANHMHKVDALAEQERWWNTQNPKLDISGVYSCCQVQDMYRAWLNLPSPTPGAKPHGPKTVSWSADTKDFTRRSADEMDWEYNA